MSNMTNYPLGFLNGITIRGLPLLQTHPGNVYWLNNSGVLPDNSVGGSNGNKGTYQKPFATLDFAFSQCKAGRGDMIVVMPGHSETYSAADGAGLDVAGVAVIGLGTGSLRPKFILDTATSTDVNVSAANITLHNIVFEAGFADVARCLQVTAANLHIDRVEFVDQASAENFVTYIDCPGTTDNEVDGLTITNCVATSPDTANEQFLKMAADVDRLTFQDNFLDLGVNSGEAIIETATGKDLTNCLITDNSVSRLNISGDIFIQNDTTANSGIVARNNIGHADTAAAIIIDLDGVRVFDNQSTASNTESGVLSPGDNAQNPTTLLKSTGSMASGFGTSDSPVTLFTVTGDVMVQIMASIDVNVTSTCATGTLSVGVPGNSALLLVQDTVDGSAFANGDSWSLSAAPTLNGALIDTGWAFIGDGGDIQLIIATNDMTAGDIDFYCRFIPMSPGASVVAA